MYLKFTFTNKYSVTNQCNYEFFLKFYYACPLPPLRYRNPYTFRYTFYEENFSLKALHQKHFHFRDML